MNPEQPADGADDERFALFQEDADRKTPARAAADLRRYGLPDSTVDALVERYERHVGRIQELEIPPVVEAEGRPKPWYGGPRASDHCWPRLRELLERGALGTGAVETLNDSTNRIVGLLEHPATAEFETKGLVLGHVQSGKTTNYTGVIAKAADRGYRLIIVLAGIHNELRRQTQSRLHGQLVALNRELWTPLTDPDRDFQPPDNAPAYFARFSTQKVLCVVKKNAAVLRKLRDWLREASDQLRNTPSLIIDDEADQAAVATRSINPLILDLLDTLPRVGYVGYTATPFANLLIDPDSENLYPRHFIVDLPKAEGHFGPESIFGREPLDGEDAEDFDDGALDMVRIVPELEVAMVRPASRADTDGFAPQVGGELRRAVLYFWLATAARRVRDKRPEHSTMLVHTSMNVSVHQSFRSPLETLRDKVAASLEGGDGEVRAELEDLWKRESAVVLADTMNESPVSFQDLERELSVVVADTRVVLDNYQSNDRLDYTGDPQVAIAVGGNTLSRGLTLEGLVVSYFVRSATAYDTLLQMGRWFGYRPGYSDLPRIWMTEELRDWFRHLAGVEAEIRLDIARYMQPEVTPETFATRIRAHPSLAITAAAKMRDAVPVAAALGGMRIQTRYFKPGDAEWLDVNVAAARGLVKSLGGAGAGKDLTTGVGRLWRSADVEQILAFLREYLIHPRSAEASSKLISSYVSRRYEAGHLKTWNVAVVGSGKSGRDTFDFGSGVGVPSVIRASLPGATPDAADIKTLMSLRDAALDLDVPKGRLTENRIRELRVAQSPDTALLAIYPIDARSAPERGTDRVPLNALREVIGVGLVFPQPPAGTDDVAYFAADLSAIAHTEDAYLEETVAAEQAALEAEQQ